MKITSGWSLETWEGAIPNQSITFSPELKNLICGKSGSKTCIMHIPKIPSSKNSGHKSFDHSSSCEKFGSCHLNYEFACSVERSVWTRTGQVNRKRADWFHSRICFFFKLNGNENDNENSHGIQELHRSWREVKIAHAAKIPNMVVPNKNGFSNKNWASSIPRVKFDVMTHTIPAHSSIAPGWT